MGDKSALKWLIKNSRNIILPMIILTIIGVLVSYIGVKAAVASKTVLDIATKNTGGNFAKAVLIIAILVGLQLILTVIYSMLNVRVLGKMKINLQRYLFSTLLEKDWQGVRSYHTGELMNRLNSDVNVITTGTVDIVPSLVTLIATIILSFTALYSIDKVFALICISVGPFMVIAARFYSKRMKNLHKQVQASDGKIRSFMQECLQNLLVIKSFRNENAMTGRASLLQMINYKLSIKRNNISIIATIVFSVVGTVGYFFALAWCAYKISIGLMTPGDLTAVTILVGQIQSPFRGLTGFIPKYFATIASAERIMEINDLPEERCINSSLDAIHIYNEMKEIKISDLSFSYGNEVVFEDSNATINKGDIVVIGGISGIGKSTLLKLILGILAPNEGKLEIVLQNGHTIPIDKQTRGLFAYVPQGNMILSGTIRDNVTFESETKSDEAVINALKAADIWDFISSLPEGLDTALGENGLGLSEGQTQRLAIARALYYDAPIILLDEATSALDEITERNVLANIKELKTKTCIVISHKRAIFDVCNCKISIKNQKISNFE